MVVAAAIVVVIAAVVVAVAVPSLSSPLLSPITSPMLPSSLSLLPFAVASIVAAFVVVADIVLTMGPWQG